MSEVVVILVRESIEVGNVVLNGDRRGVEGGDGGGGDMGPGPEPCMLSAEPVVPVVFEGPCEADGVRDRVRVLSLLSRGIIAGSEATVSSSLSRPGGIGDPLRRISGLTRVNSISSTSTVSSVGD